MVVLLIEPCIVYCFDSIAYLNCQYIIIGDEDKTLMAKHGSIGEFDGDRETWNLIQNV